MLKPVSKVAFFIGLALPFCGIARPTEQQAVYWPKDLVNSAVNLQINEIRLSMDCAEFRGIRNIPPDWNVEVVRPVSAKSQMYLSAGHGASDLPNLKDLEGAIVVGEQDSECFNLSVTIVTEDGQINLDRSKIRLVTFSGGG